MENNTAQRGRPRKNPELDILPNTFKTLTIFRNDKNRLQIAELTITDGKIDSVDLEEENAALIVADHWRKRTRKMLDKA